MGEYGNVWESIGKYGKVWEYCRQPVQQYAWRLTPQNRSNIVRGRQKLPGASTGCSGLCPLPILSHNLPYFPIIYRAAHPASLHYAATSRRSPYDGIPYAALPASHTLPYSPILSHTLQANRSTGRNWQKDGVRLGMDCEKGKCWKFQAATCKVTA